MTSYTQSEEFKTKKDFLVRKSHGKEVFVQYIEELKHLFTCPMDELVVIPLQESDTMMNSDESKSYLQYESEKLVKTIDFCDKKTLRSIIDQAYHLYAGELFVWTDYSQYCGMVKVPNILCFNIDFNFTDEHYGIINLMTADYQNQIELDYYEEDDEYFLEIEIIGRDWNSSSMVLV